jgi:hypothetical protein
VNPVRALALRRMSVWLVAGFARDVFEHEIAVAVGSDDDGELVRVSVPGVGEQRCGERRARRGTHQQARKSQQDC